MRKFGCTETEIWGPGHPYAEKLLNDEVSKSFQVKLTKNKMNLTRIRESCDRSKESKGRIRVSMLEIIDNNQVRDWWWVCNRVIASENDNNWWHSGYILNTESELLTNELDAKRWVWKT